MKLSIKQNFGDLIKLALNDNSEVRKKAIIRLYFMHSHQLLAKSEKIKFINALWNKLDKKNDLPIDTNFLDCSFIALSIGNNGVKILKNYLIKNAFPRIINISNGSRSLAIGGNQNSSYTYNLISSSNSLDKVNFISWNIKRNRILSN
ncbi:MAG: hypothetical protein IPL16_11630 [Ignavibacteria bacterium]|nr:hypothetical protein [Ignavibacteria bacterium]